MLISFCKFIQMLLSLALRGIYPVTWPAFTDHSLDWSDRVDDLVSRLTLEEVVQQMQVYYSGPTPGIPRLGINPHVWMTECLHGHVNTNGTTFPQSLGLAAAFSPEVIHNVSEATSIEFRAHNNGMKRLQRFVTYYGLSCFSPVINIPRHPLWGRNQETYGEDPYMAGELAQAHIKGLHGSHPRYVRASSGCKHLDVYAGPENIPSSRFSFDSKVSMRDWRMTFLPAFKKCVEAGTYNLVCSYNKINGVPACVNKVLLVDIVRKEWGFKGYISTDNSATNYLISQHHFFNNTLDVVVASIQASVNLELGSNPESETFVKAIDAVKLGRITEHQLREAVKPLFYTRMKQGEFDPSIRNPYSSINMSNVQSAQHQELAVITAMQTFVLLKNENNALPLKHKINTLAVLGPMANNYEQLYGDYHPNFNAKVVTTPLQGLSKVAEKVLFQPGCTDNKCTEYTSVVKAVENADTIVVCLGTGFEIEAEGNDRSSLALPGKQLNLLQDAVTAAKGKPLLLLLFTAGPVDIAWAKNQPGVHVIMECFFSGQGTGEAIARMLMNQGEASVPAARLPMTWPQNLSQVPDITNYTMVESTYRYFTSVPLYPFGYGLSYSTFTYSGLSLSVGRIEPGQLIDISVNVKNNGPYDAEEVVQIYMSWDPSNKIAPLRQLVGFKRVFIANGNTITLYFTIKGEQMEVWVDDDKGFDVLPGTMTLFVGGQQPDQKTEVLSNILSASFLIVSVIN